MIYKNLLLSGNFRSKIKQKKVLQMFEFYSTEPFNYDIYKYADLFITRLIFTEEQLFIFSYEKFEK